MIALPETECCIHITIFFFCFYLAKDDFKIQEYDSTISLRFFFFQGDPVYALDIANHLCNDSNKESIFRNVKVICI